MDRNEVLISAVLLCRSRSLSCSSWTRQPPKTACCGLPWQRQPHPPTPAVLQQCSVLMARVSQGMRALPLRQARLALQLPPALAIPRTAVPAAALQRLGLRPQLIDFLSPVHDGTSPGGRGVAAAAGGAAERAASAGPCRGEPQVHRQQQEGGRGLGLDRQLAGEGHSRALVTTPARGSRPAGVSSPEKHILDRSASPMPSGWCCALPTHAGHWCGMACAGPFMRRAVDNVQLPAAMPAHQRRVLLA